MSERIQSCHKAATIVIFGVVLLGLAACAGTPPQAVDEVVEAVPLEQEDSSQQGISLTLPPSRYSVDFTQAERALASFDWMTASGALQRIPADNLLLDDRTYLGYLNARIDFVRGRQARAIDRLGALDNLSINPALHYRILNFKRHILELQGDYIGSAALADQLMSLAPAETASSLQRSLWRNLQRAELAQLQSALTEAVQPRWHAWLELALISRRDSLDRSSNLARWSAQNVTHPAANRLPGGLQYTQGVAPFLGKIALILPLSGSLAPAGNAVLDGYLAAYYAARGSGRTPFELRVLDENNYASASAAYDDAVNEGASLVIGPLSKQGVAALATRLERPVPVLALNRVEQVLPASGSALVQLALSPDDEATRSAELAFGQGLRNALILRPAGPWGSKVEEALRQRWTALGGTVAAQANYTDREDYTQRLQSALGLTASELRAKQVRDMLAENIEFTPRRRQDPDVVFLLSRNGSQARALKPLLTYLYAGDLPVYALSSIYNGVPDDRNKDLNGIRLVETPWLLGANPALRVAIAAGDTGRGSYTRLNALGADAFLLQSEFDRLGSGPDALLRGNTGLLSMDPQLRIERELLPATFDGGSLAAH